MQELFRVIVGSHAHGLATPTSDYDYRGVFETPTTEVLRLGRSIDEVRSLEGNDDDTAWEVGKFLALATKCNPTVLEVFLAPLQSTTPLGDEVRALFPHVWHSVGVRNAFIGYAASQRKRFLANNDKRAPKYAAAYLRVMYTAWELLSTGSFSVDLRQTEIYESFQRFRAGLFTTEDVIQICDEMESRVLVAFNENPNKQANLEPVNELLLRIRRAHW